MASRRRLGVGGEGGGVPWSPVTVIAEGVLTAVSWFSECL